MMSFKDWLNNQDETSPTTRILNAPWAYPVQAVANPNSHSTATPKQLSNWNYMLKRDTKKKKKKKKQRKDESINEAKKPKKVKPQQKPNKTIDNFTKEVEAIKADLVKLREKRKKEQEKDKIKKIKDQSSAAKASLSGVKSDEKTLKFARVALTNLRHSPNFYNDREKPGIPQPDSLSDQEARKIAATLGIDFAIDKFNLSTFKKAVQAEIDRDLPRAPSLNRD